MTRVLLTGGSGFIAAHVLEVLLARGHSVVTTVRSRSKADAVKRAHPDIKDYRLSFAIVEDIAVPNGTILQNLNSEVETKVIADQANESPTHAYRASKTFAERAAWDFVEREKPNFTLSVINPPLLGPIVHSLTSLETLNTSNQRIRDLLSGAAKARCPPTGNYLFVDARDLALAHVLAVEKSEAGGKRFFTVSSHFSNAEISKIISDEFPEYKARLPTGDALILGDYPADGVYGFDNTRAREILGVDFRPLRESIIDAVKSWLPLGADKLGE